MMSPAIDLPARPTVRRYDKRSRSDLELFVLALIVRDINTPYLLRENAGLSPGATVPVLNRLASDGYLRRGEPESRRRAEYQITPKGQRYLETAGARQLQGPIPADMEAILRIATLAVLSGAARNRVADYLNRAAEMKKASSASLNKEGKPAIPSPPVDPGLYAWMQAVNKKARFLSDAAVLRKLASALKTGKR
jgi:DNA-binding PadR family transcriptional regulator